jgi:hypothetical protein
LRGVNYKTMDRNFIQQVEENEEEEKEEDVMGVPVCGGNLQHLCLIYQTTLNRFITK